MALQLGCPPGRIFRAAQSRIVLKSARPEKMRPPGVCSRAHPRVASQPHAHRMGLIARCWRVFIFSSKAPGRSLWPSAARIRFGFRLRSCGLSAAGQIARYRAAPPYRSIGARLPPRIPLPVVAPARPAKSFRSRPAVRPHFLPALRCRQKRGKARGCPLRCRKPKSKPKPTPTQTGRSCRFEFGSRPGRHRRQHATLSGEKQKLSLARLANSAQG